MARTAAGVKCFFPVFSAYFLANILATAALIVAVLDAKEVEFRWWRGGYGECRSDYAGRGG